MIDSRVKANGSPLLLRTIGALALVCLGGCATAATATPPPRVRGGVSFIGPRCAGAQSCLLGHVTAAESGVPLERAAIFLQVEGAGTSERPAAAGDAWIVALTDEQGVFTIIDPPTGSYRMAVYTKGRRVEVNGLKLGSAGTTVVPVRLPES